MKYFTGVGSRNTPNDILKLMARIALILCTDGWCLRSGGASGADSAFEQGCNHVNGHKEIFYANDATPEAMAIAQSVHPAWQYCSEYARKLHGRNSFQVLGKDLSTPSIGLICWTPDACISHATRRRDTGGTGTAISIADNYGVTIANLANKEHLANWISFVNKRTKTK
jgi:hypothetical protein